MRKFLISGCILALLAVVFGAFGAHFLKDKISPDLLVIYHTAVDYQFIHSLGILLISAFHLKYKSGFFHYAVICFLVGVLFFSGSLYLLSLRELFDFQINFLLGPMTPIGGSFFIIGWGLAIVGFLKTEIK